MRLQQRRRNLGRRRHGTRNRDATVTRGVARLRNRPCLGLNCGLWQGVGSQESLSSLSPFIVARPAIAYLRPTRTAPSPSAAPALHGPTSPHPRTPHTCSQETTSAQPPAPPPSVLGHS